MSEKNAQWFGAIGSLVLVSLVGCLVAWHRSAASAYALDPRSAEAKNATKHRVDAQREYSAGRHDVAAQKLVELIETYSDSDDRHTQDQVAAATMSLGYLAADRGDFEQARERFETIERGYAGTGAEHPEFGSLDDQAAYQAIVCLQAEGKTEAAKSQYVEFLKTRQQSPLIYAVHRRLVKLDPDRADEHEALLQSAIEARDRHVRKELAMCGPRSIEHLLELLGGPPRPIEELATLCNTTEDGTTMADMAAALQSLGYTTKGMRLNLDDFLREEAPFIWLMDTHYVVVLGCKNRRVRYYDPMYRSVRETTIAQEPDVTQTAVVLTVTTSPKEKTK